LKPDRLFGGMGSPQLVGIHQQPEAAMQPITATINDTAKALGLGRTSIYSLIREGRLEAIKLGRRTLIKVESIHRLIASA
jgi:excisionase family DNA binding protein